MDLGDDVVKLSLDLMELKILCVYPLMEMAMESKLSRVVGSVEEDTLWVALEELARLQLEQARDNLPRELHPTP